MREQKFVRGDRVKVHRPVSQIGNWLSVKPGEFVEFAPIDTKPDLIGGHGQLATVVGSYFDLYGGSDPRHRTTYEIKCDEKGYPCAWFDDHELILVAPRSMETLDALDGIA